MQRFRGTVPFISGIACVGLLAASAEARVCEVSMHIGASATLGALQLDLDYAGTDGLIATGGAKLLCKGDVSNALTIFGHDEEAAVVTTSTVSLVGFSGPGQVAHCTFEDPEGTTVEGDFGLRVVDSTDLLGDPVEAPRVSVEYGPCDDDPTTTTSTTSTTSSTTTSTTSTTETTTTTLEDCGDGFLDDGEDCDDGNDEDGDGCDSECRAEILCGDANGNDTVQSSDALLVLRAATGQPVTCPDYYCDANGDALLRASDSLRILKHAVGLNVPMSCPDAPE